jgi:NADPH:quinone reductase-like Zn-dependent oxidoreductase
MEGLQLRSLVDGDTLHLSLVKVAVAEPGDDEVVVRIDATPINPSDIGLLVGAADMTAATFAGSGAGATVTAPIPAHAQRAMASRAGQSLPVGTEGAGEVIAAGRSAQHLLGRTVATRGGAMYSQYRTVRAADCLVLPPDVTAADGASCFVNPLTALGMTETMRREGHTALVHTAAASNLGQMLQKVCLEERIPIVNVIRSDAQAQVLRALGATHVVDSSKPSFFDDLVVAVGETGATLAFDAIGGGLLADELLTAMEIVAARRLSSYSRYGSSTPKQVYIYGSLDPGPTTLRRRFGLTWGIGGWLLMPFLQKIGPAEVQRLERRVVSGLKTTFSPDAVAAYLRRATGEKYLIAPSIGL